MTSCAPGARPARHGLQLILKPTPNGGRTVLRSGALITRGTDESAQRRVRDADGFARRHVEGAVENRAQHSGDGKPGDGGDVVVEHAKTASAKKHVRPPSSHRRNASSRASGFRGDDDADVRLPSAD